MDISGVAGQLSKWKAVAGQGWHAVWHRRALLSPQLCPSSLSFTQSLPVTGYWGSGVGGKKSLVCFWTRRFCASVSNGLKKEHLKFNVSKVKFMLCNRVKTGLHFSQPFVLKSNSSNHIHNLTSTSYVCVCVRVPPCDCYDLWGGVSGTEYVITLKSHVKLEVMKRSCRGGGRERFVLIYP